MTFNLLNSFEKIDYIRQKHKHIYIIVVFTPTLCLSVLHISVIVYSSIQQRSLLIVIEK